jgi:uncharacterized protein YoxC
MIQKTLKKAVKDLVSTDKTIAKMKKQLENHQKEHQRFELRATKLKEELQKKLEDMQTKATANIEAARAKEAILVPLLTQQIQLQASIDTLNSLAEEA